MGFRTNRQICSELTILSSRSNGGTMLGVESAVATRAGVVIGAVLVEALSLYVGYGALERVAGPWLTRKLEGR